MIEICIPNGVSLADLPVLVSLIRIDYEIIHIIEPISWRRRRNRQRYRQIRIEGYTHIITLWAVHPSLELPTHQILNNGIISFQMSFPGFLGNDVIRPSVMFDLLCVNLVFNPVQVLMKAVKYIGDEL